MSILADFSVDTFNGLVSDYHDVRHYGDSDKKLPEMCPIINKFGDLFLKHNKEEHLALGLCHRHFKLNPGEKKVARQDSDTVLTIKATSKDEIRKLLDKHQGAKILPYLFIPTTTADGSVSLQPLEYVLHTDKDIVAALEADIEAVCDEAFLKAFLDLAARNKVDGVYSILLRNRHSLKFDNTNQSTLEQSRCGDRTLVVNVVDNTSMDSEDTTTVAWDFRKDANGKVVPVSACSSHSHGGGNAGPWCNHTCNHCGHCYYGGH